jgi:hypothetical protein
MSVLGRPAVAQLATWGITRRQWIAEHGGTDGKWYGDRCGCPDDRCTGFHHAEDAFCGCVEALAKEYSQAAG